MIANNNKKIELKHAESFFDYFTFDEIELFIQFNPEKTAEKISEKIRLNQIVKELPEHCTQLLFIS